jgi:8-oxo-dGTP diphosphatase
MARFGLQFGQTLPGGVYPERDCAYGLGVRDGAIALARIGRAGGPFVYDLPGGGVEPGEDEVSALIREFREEVGLAVRPGRLLLRAGQYWVNGSAPRNSLAAFFWVELEGEPIAPSEPDHALEWMSPLAAMTAVRHEAHAWAIALWLREGGL